MFVITHRGVNDNDKKHDYPGDTINIMMVPLLTMHRDYETKIRYINFGYQTYVFVYFSYHLSFVYNIGLLSNVVKHG